MKIYIDFDKTLFDSVRFLEDFYRLIEDYDISREMFNNCRNQYKIKFFRPYTILDLISKKNSVDKEVYLKVEELINSSSNYLFPDTIPFLKYLKSKKKLVTILTRGDYEFQMSKILNTHIDEYYSDVIVTDKHKGELDVDYTNGIFIDDCVEEINSIISMKPKRVISIQRKGIINSEDVETIVSLTELIDNI